MAGDAVFVRDGKQHVRLSVNEILYLEADDDSTHLHTVSRSYTVGCMLKDVLEGLASERMERVHRSFAVNLDRVQAVSDNGLHVGERWLPIGRSYRSGVMQRLRLI